MFQVKLAVTKYFHLNHLLSVVTLPLVGLCVCLFAVTISISVDVQARRNVVIGKSDDFIVLYARKRQSLEELAERYLGSPDKAWIIAETNGITKIKRDRELVIPLKTRPGNLSPSGYQLIPVLIYHRFGRPANKMTVTPEAFEEQLKYLDRHDYNVVALEKLQLFLKGKQALPKKTVVITIDDGYRSVYKFAMPLIKKYRVPVTLFVYSDYINNGGLSFRQMRELKKTGLVSIQPHSKTHANLTDLLSNETKRDYKQRLQTEVEHPKHFIRSKLGNKITSFAYPYGDFNDHVVDQVKRSQYQLGLTVSLSPEGNAVFSSPWVLRRRQVLGGRDINDFQSLLKTYQKTP